MFTYDSDFVREAAAMLQVSEDSVRHAMAQVDADEDAGVEDHNPVLLGIGGFCGPTTGEWCGANGLLGGTVSDGRYRAAIR